MFPFDQYMLVVFKKKGKVLNGSIRGKLCLVSGLIRLDQTIVTINVIKKYIYF